MTTTTATPSPLTPAELAAFYDAQIASERAAAAAKDAERQAAIEEMRNQIDAELAAALTEAGIDLEYTTLQPGGSIWSREAKISIPGFWEMTARADYSADQRRISLRVFVGGDRIDGATFGEAMAAALANARDLHVLIERQHAESRAKYAAEEAARQAEQAQRRQHDADALAAWAPLYRRYLADLSAAYRHNAAILRPIAEEYGRQEFSAARLTYGITAEESDPTTETVWIDSADTWSGYYTEINPKTGRTEPAHFIHVVKITWWRTYTAADAYARRDWRDEAPPTRRTTIRTGAGNWQIVAPPAAGDLRSEIEPQLGDLASAPERPDLPALWQPHTGEELARQIEAEIIPDADERAALVEALAGDFPSADPIPF